MRVLIVDDERSNRLIIRRAVEQDGYETLEAENGISALELLKSEAIDIVLLDIMMPEMDGLTVCRHIRETKLPTELPVIFITARVEDDDLVEGFAAGGNDYIVKPINMSILRARLSTQAQIVRATQALASTYRKLAESKSMETIGLFSAGIAHNFNNLLGTILGSAELIQLDSEQGSDSAHAAELIITSAHRGSELTSSLLTLTRTSDALYCLKPASIINSTRSLLSTISNSSIIYNIEMPEAFPPLHIPESGLARVLLELLKNSATAIKEVGEITLRICCHEDKNTVVFELSDTGCGIPQDRVENIFLPFFSAKDLDRTTGITFDGSGLGLSAVYNIIEQVKGKIEIVNTSAAGTTIRFSIPISHAVEE